MPGGDILRGLYPQILSLTYDKAKELGDADPQHRADWLNLAHDLHRQRVRSMHRSGIGLVFEGWPYKRNPFAQMSFDYPTPPSFTSIMQTQYDMTLNGNMWFGIGVWGLAEEYYKAAIRLCVVSNDTVAALQNGANLALCYLAGSDWVDALRLCQHLINASIDHLDGPIAASVFQQAGTILRWCYIKSGEEYFTSQHTAWLLEVAADHVSLDSSVFDVVREIWEAIGDGESLRQWEKEWEDLQRLVRAFETPSPDETFEETWGAAPRDKLELILPAQRRPQPNEYLDQMNNPTEQFVLLGRRAWGTVGRHVYRYGLSAAVSFIASLPPDHPFSAEQLDDIKAIITHSFYTGFRLFVSVIALNGLDVAFHVDLDLDPLIAILDNDEQCCAALYSEYDVTPAVTALGEDIFVFQYYRGEMDSLPFRYPYSVRLEILDSIFAAYLLCMLAGVTPRYSSSSLERGRSLGPGADVETEECSRRHDRPGERSGNRRAQAEAEVDARDYLVAKGRRHPVDRYGQHEMDVADYYEALGLIDSAQSHPSASSEAGGIREGRKPMPQAQTGGRESNIDQIARLLGGSREDALRFYKDWRSKRGDVGSTSEALAELSQTLESSHSGQRSAARHTGTKEERSQTGWWYRPKDSETCRYSPGDEVQTRVVGVTYEGRQAVVAKLTVGEAIHLRREPNNPYDRNAVRVERTSGEQIGYVGRALAKDIAPHFDRYGGIVTGRVTALVGSGEQGWNRGARIAFSIPHPR